MKERTPEEILAYCKAAERNWKKVAMQVDGTRTFAEFAMADLPRMAKEVIGLRDQVDQLRETIARQNECMDEDAGKLAAVRALCGEAAERLHSESVSYAMATSSRVHPGVTELIGQLKAAAEGKDNGSQGQPG